MAHGLAAGPLWIQTWADEGVGAANTAPDASKWRYDLGGGGWGNNELESYTNRTVNSRYDGAGNLVIEARAEAYTGSDGIPRNYTSARLLTRDTFTQAYGRFEARMRLPYGQGIWPAFWMLGDNIGPAGWPACGEIDIMENVGFEPTITHGTIHGPGYSGGAGIGASFDLGVPVSGDYHVYAVEWEPGIIRWYVDGVERVARTQADLPGGTTWVYDHPNFMLLNLAVGGQWPGNPDGSTVFPQQMTMDYVRVYRRDTTQRPYHGSALPIPGTIQAEDFDDGGPGVAYNDTTVGHPGGFNYPRNSEQVDLEACTDAGGGDDLGWTAPGEWLEYTVDVAAAGDYALSVRVASADAGGSFRFELDGTPLANSQFTVPNSGGWQTWTTLGPQTVTLPAGQHVLRLAFLGAGPGGGCGNFNGFRFDSLVAPSATATRSPTPSPSRTRTPQASPSASPSATATRTPSASPGPSPTASPSRTASASPSGTAAVSPSATPTASSTVKTSPSVSPTPTASSNITPPLTATLSPTLSATPSAGPVYTETATPSLSASASASPSASATATLSGTLTLSRTPVPSGTATPGSTASATLTATLSPSAAPSPLATATASATAQAAASATATASPPPDASPSPTPSVSAPVTPPPAGSEAVPPEGLPQLLPLSNPQRGPRLRFAIRTSGLARAELRCYSPAMALVRELDLGALAPGWHEADLDAAGLAAGLYWARLSADGKGLGKPVRILLLPN